MEHKSPVFCSCPPTPVVCCITWSLAAHPIPILLALVQFVNATVLLHKLILQSAMILHWPLPIAHSYSLFRSQLLREASSGTVSKSVPLVISALGTMYLSPITPITATLLHPFV